MAPLALSRPAQAPLPPPPIVTVAPQEDLGRLDLGRSLTAPPPYVTVRIHHYSPFPPSFLACLPYSTLLYTRSNRIFSFPSFLVRRKLLRKLPSTYLSPSFSFSCFLVFFPFSPPLLSPTHTHTTVMSGSRYERASSYGTHSLGWLLGRELILPLYPHYRFIPTMLRMRET